MMRSVWLKQSHQLGISGIVRNNAVAIAVRVRWSSWVKFTPQAYDNSLPQAIQDSVETSGV